MSDRTKAFGVYVAALCVLVGLILAWVPTLSSVPATVPDQKASSVAADDN